MTPAEVFALARAVLPDDERAVIATAIAWAESGLDPNAVGDTTLTDSVWGASIGLFQIRSMKAQRGTGTERDADRLKDPSFNASAMARISSGGTNWRPWSVYTSGAYNAYVPKVRDAIDSGGHMASADTAIGFYEANDGLGENPGGSNCNWLTEWAGVGCVPWCFGPGTLIDTPSGMTPIENLSPGDDVLDQAGKGAVVVAVSDRVAPTVHLRVLGLDATTVTPEHPYWARRRIRSSTVRNPGTQLRGHIRSFEPPEWVPVGDLQRGDLIGFPLPREWGALPMDPALARLLGRWVGDGWRGTFVRGTTDPTRTGHVHDRFHLCSAFDEEDEVRKLLIEAGVRAHEKRRKTATQFEFYASRSFREAADGFGKGAAHKRIPGKVFLWPREARQALLDGYVSADGWVNPATNDTMISTASRELALGTAKLARSLGLAPRVQVTRRNRDQWIQGRAVRCHEQQWTVGWRTVTERSKVEWIRDEDFLWSPVRSVEPVEPGTVYNLEVSGSHTFVADGAAVHNCAITTSRALNEAWGDPDRWQVPGIQPTFSWGFAYVPYFKNTFVDAGLYTSEPGAAEKGDAVIFSWGGDGAGDHIGLFLRDVDGETCLVWEGNTSDNDLSLRRRPYALIDGFCKIPYDDQGDDMFSDQDRRLLAQVKEEIGWLHTQQKQVVEAIDADKDTSIIEGMIPLFREVLDRLAVIEGRLPAKG